MGRTTVSALPVAWPVRSRNGRLEKLTLNNQANDLYLGYDVCHLSLNNLTMNALYNSHSDTGNCLQTMDADCINAMQAVVTSRANILTTPSSYGPDSNLVREHRE